jgi:hypothetical protein
MDNYLMNAFAWGIAATAFCCVAWWVNGLRKSVRYYIGKLEDVAFGMSAFDDGKDAKEYAQRLLKMSPEELEHEIETGRLIARWGKEISATIEGLKASVPFLGGR